MPGVDTALDPALSTMVAMADISAPGRCSLEDLKVKSIFGYMMGQWQPGLYRKRRAGRREDRSEKQRVTEKGGGWKKIRRKAASSDILRTCTCWV